MIITELVVEARSSFTASFFKGGKRQTRLDNRKNVFKSKSWKTLKWAKMLIRLMAKDIHEFQGTGAKILVSYLIFCRFLRSLIFVATKMFFNKMGRNFARN